MPHHVMNIQKVILVINHEYKGGKHYNILSDVAHLVMISMQHLFVSYLTLFV